MKLKNKIVALFLTVACAFGLAVANNAQRVEAADVNFTLVTSVSDLSVDDKVIIVASGYNFALSTTQNGNNRGQTAVVKNGTEISVDDTGTVQILTLKEGLTSGTFAFYTGTGYLYAASSSKNYLRTEDTLTANSSWNIAIDANGVATVKATGEYTRNMMKYNQSSALFSAYSSGQKDISIYKQAAALEKTDEVKLQEALTALSIDSAYSYNALLPIEGSHGATITWASSDTSIISVNNTTGIATVSKNANEQEVTLTATVTVGDKTGTKDFDVVVNAINPNEPLVGVEYKLMLTQGNLDVDLYATGAISSSKYLTTSESYSDGAVFGLELAPYNGYYISVMVDGTKKYVNSPSTGVLNVSDEPSTIWGYSSTYETLTTVANGVEQFIGTFDQYTTLSVSNVSYIASGNFVSQLVPNDATPEELINGLETGVQFGINFTETVTEREVEVEPTSTITFDDTSKRTYLSNEQQVWEENGIKVTGDKASSTIAIADYSNPARFYKNSNITIEAVEMVKITFNCNTASYATALADTIGVTANDSVVIVELTEATDKYFIESVGAQVRIDSIEVTTANSEGGTTIVTETTYGNFNNAKLRFVGIIPAELTEYVNTEAGAGVVLTLPNGKKQTVYVPEEKIVTEADGSLRFAVVLNVPAEQYDTVVTGQAFVYLHDATEATYLAEKSFSVNSIVEYYLGGNVTLTDTQIAVLKAFQAA